MYINCSLHKIWHLLRNIDDIVLYTSLEKKYKKQLFRGSVFYDDSLYPATSFREYICISCRKSFHLCL